MYNQDTIARFNNIIKIDVGQLLSDFVDFNTNLKQDIIDYYNGDVSTPNMEAFDTLSNLQYRVNQVINSAMLTKRRFTLLEDWELLNELEEVKTKLATVENSSKFLRSAISKNNFNPNPLVDVTLKQNQTLERLASDLNSQDPQNEWTQIFLNNKLIEEDYTPEGGVLLKVTFQGADSLFLNSVVDNIDSGEKTYGLDIDQTLKFENNDLKVLTYKETLLQSIEILSQLRKGDNPQRPDQGIDASLAIGSTIGSVTFPSLFRQLYNTFATNDSFKRFVLRDVSIEGDAVKLDFGVTTKVGEVQSGTLII